MTRRESDGLGREVAKDGDRQTMEDLRESRVRLQFRSPQEEPKTTNSCPGCGGTRPDYGHPSARLKGSLGGSPVRVRHTGKRAPYFSGAFRRDGSNAHAGDTSVLPVIPLRGDSRVVPGGGRPLRTYATSAPGVPPKTPLCVCCPVDIQLAKLKRVSTSLVYGWEFEVHVHLTTFGMGLRADTCSLEWWEYSTDPPAYKRNVGWGPNQWHRVNVWPGGIGTETHHPWSKFYGYKKTLALDPWQCAPPDKPVVLRDSPTFPYGSSHAGQSKMLSQVIYVTGNPRQCNPWIVELFLTFIFSNDANGMPNPHLWRDGLGVIVMPPYGGAGSPLPGIPR